MHVAVGKTFSRFLPQTRDTDHPDKVGTNYCRKPLSGTCTLFILCYKMYLNVCLTLSCSQHEKQRACAGPAPSAITCTPSTNNQKIIRIHQIILIFTNRFTDCVFYFKAFHLSAADNFLVHHKLQSEVDEHNFDELR